jgi:hypothetical protein
MVSLFRCCASYLHCCQVGDVSSPFPQIVDRWLALMAAITPPAFGSPTTITTSGTPISSRESKATVSSSSVLAASVIVHQHLVKRSQSLLWDINSEHNINGYIRAANAVDIDESTVFHVHIDEPPFPIYGTPRYALVCSALCYLFTNFMIMN